MRAKRCGELAGPNPPDRRKLGTKYQVVFSTDGIPLAAPPRRPRSTMLGSSPNRCAWADRYVPVGNGNASLSLTRWALARIRAPMVLDGLLG
jgi:hypothetical protein